MHIGQAGPSPCARSSVTPRHSSTPAANPIATRANTRSPPRPSRRCTHPRFICVTASTGINPTANPSIDAPPPSALPDTADAETAA